MPRYDASRIEPKWQRYWDEHKTFRVRTRTQPSRSSTCSTCSPTRAAHGLHVGHPEGYTATDISARYKRMRGFNVLHPMGWDAFGLPAEQYAIKTGTHPRVTTEKNIDTFRRQIKMLGFSYDWDREVDTTDPDYFKWTQWIFLQLFDTWYRSDASSKRGRPIDANCRFPTRCMAARAKRRCRRVPGRATAGLLRPKCRSTGARAWGRCWPTRKSSTARASAAAIPVVACRCGSGCCASPPTPSGCSTTWSWSTGPESIKEMQRNWIGRSEGAEVDFYIGTCDVPGARGIRAGSRRERSRNPRRSASSPPGPTRCSARPTWCSRRSIRWSTASPRRSRKPPSKRTSAEAARKSDLERTELAKKKTGVFTGAYAINPVNDERDPDLDRRLRADRATAPARSWRCRRTTSATSSSPRSSTCRSSTVVAAAGRVARGRSAARWTT